MNQNNVKRASTATAKPKGARVRATKNDFALKKEPIGWHFIGHREQPIYSFEEMSAESEYWMWRSEKYRIAFYIAMVGLLIIGAMNIFK